MSSVSRKILHIINGEHYSGAERVQDLLAEQLKPLGYEVSFVTLKTGLFKEKRNFTEAPIYNLLMRNKFDWSVAYEIKKIIKKNDFHIVHTHTPRAALVGRLASTFSGIPMVHHVHSPTQVCTEKPFRNFINHRIERISIKGIKRIIAVSCSLKEHLINLGITADKIKVVCNGVPSSGAFIKTEYQKDRLKFGIVALFRPRKGLECLLKAIHLLKKEGLHFKIKFIGPFDSNEYERKIKALVNKLGLEDYIEWVGFTNDVTSEYYNMDVLILPSLHGEGMPMVILEAMAAGTPVIGSQVEGIPEVIRNGVEGVLFKPGDAIHLANAMRNFILGTLDLDDMRKKAWQRHADMFSDITMTQGVSQVYKDVLSDV